MPWVYLLLLLGSLGYAVLRGGLEQRILSATMLAASLGTYGFYKAGLRFDDHPEPFIAASLLHLAISLAVALWSSRFWPMFYAALQIATLLSLLSPLFGRNLLSYALGVMQAVWTYPQLLILVVATIRMERTTSSAR